ncbi:unnamed protein product [Hymenolepis diminuta]|uniref:Homeobox domain-containing protein n=1 Tax=Hymenolepis diminuta TaxID=6216 RepID=A0A564YYG9_HYMDI|nr:unnamed protein product [Hymenolepis diminuta]
MDEERQIITMNCVPSCHHQQNSPLTYACSNTSNNSTSNPSCYSPNVNEVSDPQDIHMNSATSMQDLTGHPLYPLLAVLFRQCEAGTVRPCSPPALDLFNEELRIFIDRTTSSLVNNQPIKRSQSPQQSRLSHLQTSSSDDKSKSHNDDANREVPLNVFMADPELNELIFLAVKVLRIHLQELHKVNELSKDFCSRYITSLKTKFQSDLLRFQDSEPSSPTGSEGTSPFGTGCYSARFPSGPGEYSRYSLGGLLAYNGSADNGVGSGEGDAYGPGGTFGDAACSENSEAAGYQPGYINELKMNGSGGFISPGAPGASYFSNRVANSLNGMDGGPNSSRTKRGVLPKRATQVMKQWLFQHLVHPYPTEDEKRQIASQTNLTLLQVNNWFINARRRILQPMLETTGPYSSSGRSGSGEGVCGWGGHKSRNGDQPLVNKKKKAATTRPSNNRFWPASLAAAAALLPNAGGVISAASSNRNTETTLVWAKSQSNPSGTLPESVRSGIQNEGSPSESAGDGESSSSSMKSRSRKLSSIECKDMRHDGGVYADFALGRFSSYPYGQDGSAAQISKHDLSYDSRALNSASTYQSFLQQAVLQQHQHPNGVDVKPSHSLPSAAQNYNNWSHFLEDRNAAQHAEYGVPSVGSAIQYPRPEDGIYFSGQPHSWSYNTSSNQTVSSATLSGGISTDVRLDVQAESNWPQVNSSSYPTSSFPVEAERSVL